MPTRETSRGDQEAHLVGDPEARDSEHVVVVDDGGGRSPVREQLAGDLGSALGHVVSRDNLGRKRSSAIVARKASVRISVWRNSGTPATRAIRSWPRRAR